MMVRYLPSPFASIYTPFYRVPVSLSYLESFSYLEFFSWLSPDLPSKKSNSSRIEKPSSIQNNPIPSSFIQHTKEENFVHFGRYETFCTLKGGGRRPFVFSPCRSVGRPAYFAGASFPYSLAYAASYFSLQCALLLVLYRNSSFLFHGKHEKAM